MKRISILYILILICLPLALSAQSVEELQGVWNWPVPEFEEGTMNFEFINHTLVLEPGKWKKKYTLYDENRKKYASGKYNLKNGVLTLGKRQYSIQVNDLFMGGEFYELCLVNEGAAPYFSIDRKEYQLLSDCVENFEQGNYQEVVEIAAFAEKLGIQNTSHMMEKAKALLELGKDDEARKVLEKILALEPGDPDAEGYIEMMDKPRKK